MPSTTTWLTTTSLTPTVSLIVPEVGAIRVFTEMGIIDVEPSEICLIPRGMMFKVSRLGDGEMRRGYVCENYGAKFTLPDRGPIGAGREPGQSARLQDADRCL